MREKIDTILKDISTSSFCDDEEIVYEYSKLVQVFDNVEKLDNSQLIVAYNDSDCWYDFVFLTWSYGSDEGDFYQQFCKASGPSDFLRECRHTNFSNDGYLFYMNRTSIEAMLGFLSKYYDLD